MARLRNLAGMEWPTVLLAAGIHGGWLALTLSWHRLPAWLVLLIGAWLGAWYMSLQHEVMHGHPTRSRRCNDAIGFAPLMLWMPYLRYRDTHLRHHRDDWLTDPLEDPESAYFTLERWQGQSTVARGLHLASVTLLGRLFVGPFMAIASFWISEFRLIAARQMRIARIWAGHLVGVAILLGWLVGICHVDVTSYLLMVVWPGTGLSLLRSLVEHRAAARPQDRTAIVECGGLLALLFLNNNIHVVHHLYPGVPWYRLPALWREQKVALRQSHRGPYYRSYVDVARQFLVAPHNRGVIPIAGRRP